MKNLKKAMVAFILLTSVQALASADYTLTKEQGSVHFTAKGFPALLTIKGEAAGVVGKLTEAEGKVSGELNFDLKSLSTGIELRDEHMKNNYLQVDEFPTSKLTLADVAIEVKKGYKAKFSGTMLIHGEEKSVSGTLEVLEVKDGAVAKFKASLPIKISDYKIPIPNYKGITVAEDVLVEVESSVTAAPVKEAGGSSATAAESEVTEASPHG